MSKVLLAALFTALPFAASISAVAAPSSWRCNFPDFDEPMTFLDLGNGQGKVIGNAGTGDLLVHNGDRGISFIEPLSSGAVQVLTIVRADGDASYTRNTILGPPGDQDPGFSPSWRRGKCTPWQ